MHAASLGCKAMEFSCSKFKRNNRIYNIFNNNCMSIQIEEYVRQTYKQRFKDKPVLVTENDACFMVTHHVDASPIVLSKNQWRNY